MRHPVERSLERRRRTPAAAAGAAAAQDSRRRRPIVRRPRGPPRRRPLRREDPLGRPPGGGDGLGQRRVDDAARGRVGRDRAVERQRSDVGPAVAAEEAPQPPEAAAAVRVVAPRRGEGIGEEVERQQAAVGGSAPRPAGSAVAIDQCRLRGKHAQLARNFSALTSQQHGRRWCWRRRRSCHGASHHGAAGGGGAAMTLPIMGSRRTGIALRT